MKRLVYPGLVALLVALAALIVPAGAHQVSAAASLRLSRSFVAPGDTITVQGFGFTPQDDVVVAANLTVNGHAQRAVSSSGVDSSGSFSTPLTIPSGTAQGVYDVTARDFHGHVAVQRLIVYPLAFLAAGGRVYTVFVIPQHAFFVSGAGFQPGETVNLATSFPLYSGNTVVVNRNVVADSHGNFSEAFVRVPNDARALTTPITAAGQSTKKTAKNDLRVVYRPFLLNPGTVRPGTSIPVSGREFVPDSNVDISVNIGRSGATNITLSRSVTASDHGNFDTSLGLPSDVLLGRYTISAVDRVGGFAARTTVVVSIHPTITVQPNTIFPGEATTVAGDNFGSGAAVTVSANFPLEGGGTKTVSATTTTGSRGNYSANLAAPANAAAATVTVVARASGGSVSTHLRVQQRPPTPTATATSTAVPSATATATPVPVKHGHFGFRYVSIWYHTVRVCTWDHVVVQSALDTTQGIWTNVWFPNGGHLVWYTNTNRHGHYEKQFTVPCNSINGGNTHVLVTFRLWHGGQSRRYFAGFNLTH